MYIFYVNLFLHRLFMDRMQSEIDKVWTESGGRISRALAGPRLSLIGQHRQRERQAQRIEAPRERRAPPKTVFKPRPLPYILARPPTSRTFQQPPAFHVLSPPRRRRSSANLPLSYPVHSFYIQQTKDVLQRSPRPRRRDLSRARDCLRKFD